MSSIKKEDEHRAEEKKEVFEPPKATDLEGKEIKGHVEEKDLGTVSGGVAENVADDSMIPGHLCLGGG